MEQNKHIIVGVTGSIAAYKSAELIRRLREQGYEVRVVMTRAAEAFITPLTLQALSGREVARHLLDAESEAAMDHISLARWADTILVAPATANFIARLAHGLADDLLTTLCMASTAPIHIAPAMNQQMWINPATQQNISILMDRNISILGPGQGEQACGEVGPGRMLEPHELLTQLHNLTTSKLMAGCRVLLTAGPTREEIDPVRYISNHSSGKMGYMLAHAFLQAGAEVTMVSGPVKLHADPAIKLIKVDTAEQMYTEVMGKVADQDIFIGAAAVADYRPVKAQKEKIKKTGSAGMTLELTPNPDILASVCALAHGPFCVGFAAETNNLHTHAKEKLARKGAQMIVANEVGGPVGGFNSNENAVTVFWQDDYLHLPLASKQQIARELLRIIAERYLASREKTA